MKRRKAFLFSILFLVYALTTAVAGGQAADLCSEQDSVKCECKVKAEGWLKQDPCKEQRLSVAPLTDRRNAEAFPVEATIWHKDRLETLRREYFLDQDSVEEHISYSTVPNYFKYPQARVKIDLINPQAIMKVDLSRNSLPKKE